MKRTLLGKHCTIVYGRKGARVYRGTGDVLYAEGFRVGLTGNVSSRLYRPTPSSRLRLERAYHTF